MYASDALLTLVIPTRNRPNFLFRLLSYLQTETHFFKILIADSSSEDILSKNKNTIENFSMNVHYLVESYNSDPKMPAYTKLQAATHEIKTPYACIIADDDIFDVQIIRKCLHFLEKNKEYSACHGKFVGFSPDKSKYALTHIEYDGDSLDNDNTAKRVLDYFMNYEAIFYAVFRTPVIKNAFDFAITQPSAMYAELAVGFIAVISGKVERLPEVFAYRWPQIGSYHRNFYWEPLSYIEDKAQAFFEDFWIFRNSAIEQWNNSNQLSIDKNQMEKIITYAFLGYLPKLGTNTLPDELQSHFANIFHKKPVSFRLFINRKFVSFAFFKILLDIDCWLWTKIRTSKKVGKLTIHHAIIRGLSRKDIKRAMNIFEHIPYMEDGGH